jgi:hypothetical protein
MKAGANHGVAGKPPKGELAEALRGRKVPER